MTPLAPRAPYNAVAAPSFSTDIVSTSSSVIVFNERGKPSTIIKGVPSPKPPRPRTFSAASACQPTFCFAYSPGNNPYKEFCKIVAVLFSKTSEETVETACVRFDRFFLIYPKSIISASSPLFPRLSAACCCPFAVVDSRNAIPTIYNNLLFIFLIFYV